MPILPIMTSWVSAASLAADPRMTGLTLPNGVTPQTVVDAATAHLFKATGRRYRLGTATVRPNRTESACDCSWGCSCSTAGLVLHPYATEVTAVVVDGVTLDPSAYVLYDGRTLVRQDGRRWPCCQDLGVPLGQPGTWSVTYTYGRMPDAAGQMACRELAIHYAMRAASNPAKPPARTIAVNRQGASQAIARPQPTKAIDVFLTGIDIVDDFIRAENPFGLTRGSSISSPDSPRRSRLPQ